MIKGQRAPRDLQAPGGVVLWVFDATDSEAEIARLGEERAEALDAFDALTGLIEAAPLPMWYRGPDLRLAMVNSAYVEAVEAPDAADVIRRGVELVEGSGIGGPLASAVIARDTGKPQMQTMPATIRTMRRMLRVYDVPLPTGGVAGFAVDIEELEQARSGIKRFADAQRAMLDRLSAGVVQCCPRSHARLLQPAVSPTVRDEERVACRPAGIRPRHWSACAKPIACPRCAISLDGRRSGATGSLRRAARSRSNGICREACICALWRSPCPMAGCC